MELYTLDSLLRRERVIDRFQSCIWTERFSSKGDLVLTLQSNAANRSVFTKGTLLACNKSYRVMQVENVEDATSAEGKATLKITGPSIEDVLSHRVAKNVLGNLTTYPKWILTGAPAEVARQIFHDICVTGVLDVGDQIPFINEGLLLPASYIPEPVDPITVEMDLMTVYDVIKQICDAWTLGFRLLRNFDNSELYFDIYSGNDRTTQQSTYGAVVFAPELDNLQNTTELTSIANYKNVAYVMGPGGFTTVYSPDAPPDMTGFNRRVMYVNADDVTAAAYPDPDDLLAALVQRGANALAEQRQFTAFDGEINQNSQYQYERDYFLGDLIEQRNRDGATNLMRVTEQIFVSDEQGERSYPTLTQNLFIDTGSWLSWDAQQEWEDVDDSLHWPDA